MGWLRSWSDEYWKFGNLSWDRHSQKYFWRLKLYSRHLREQPKILEDPFGEGRSFMSWSWLIWSLAEILSCRTTWMTFRLSEVTTEWWKGTGEKKCDKRADRLLASRLSYEDSNFEFGSLCHMIKYRQLHNFNVVETLKEACSS